MGSEPVCPLLGVPAPRERRCPTGPELVADTAAVRISGKQATADALHRVAIVGIAEEVLRHDYILPMLQAGRRPADLATGRRSLLSSAERIEQILAMSQEGPQTTDPWATHPPTDVRIQRVAAVEATAPASAPDERPPARALFRDPDRWVRAAEDRWFSLITGDASMPVAGWDEWADLVMVPEMQARADAVDRALAQIQLPPGLTGVRAAFAQERERDLAATLVSQGWRVEAPDARQVILQAAITASTVRAALDSGRASFVTSWSGPVALLDPSGVPVDVQAAADAALAEDWTLLDSIAPAPSMDEAARRVGQSPRPSPQSEQPFPVPGAPFAPVDGRSSTYAAALPGRIGGKTRIEVAPTAIVLQGTTVAWDALGSATIDLKAPGDSGGSLTISLEDVSGGKLRAKASAATVKGTEPIVAAASYLWDLLRIVPGPRLRAAIVERVRAGEDIEVGGVIVNTAGVALAKKPAQVVSWSAVADVVVVERRVVVRATDRDGIVTTLGSPNTFLLPDLVPELRVLFG